MSRAAVKYKTIRGQSHQHTTNISSVTLLLLKTLETQAAVRDSVPYRNLSRHVPNVGSHSRFSLVVTSDDVGFKGRPSTPGRGDGRNSRLHGRAQQDFRRERAIHARCMG